MTTTTRIASTPLRDIDQLARCTTPGEKLASLLGTAGVRRLYEAEISYGLRLIGEVRGEPARADASRVADLREAIGDAGACSDGECTCHRVANEAREELIGMLDHDPIDAWKALRDSGLSELELRAMAGDR